MFFPEIVVLPVSSQARNTARAALLRVVFHFLAGARPKRRKAAMSNNKVWAPSRSQTVLTRVTRRDGHSPCVASVRAAAEKNIREGIALLLTS